MDDEEIPKLTVIGDAEADSEGLRCDHCGEPTSCNQEGSSYSPAGYVSGDGWSEWEEESILCKKCFAKLEAYIEAEVAKIPEHEATASHSHTDPSLRFDISQLLGWDCAPPFPNKRSADL